MSLQLAGNGPGIGGASTTVDTRFGRLLALTGRLAFRDLRDELLLSLCLVSAIAAVLAPIMVLAGLKYGFIEIMRSKLIQDPSFRLITPVSAQNRGDAFFKSLRARPDMAFVQPTILQSGTQARLETADGKKGEQFDIEPTGEGDPLILENEGAVPDAGEVTLSAPGAEALGVKAGDSITIVIFRSLGGRRESQRVTLKVKSVLRVAADVQRRAYVPLELVQDIERYKAGITVSSRGWIGVARPPDQAFDGVYLLLETGLKEDEMLSLGIGKGFAEARVVEPAAFKQATGLDAGDAVEQIVLLVNTSKPVSAQQVASIPAALGDRKFRLLPVAQAMEVVPEGSSKAVPVRSIDLNAFKLEVVKGEGARLPSWRTEQSYIQVERVLLPKSLAETLKIEPGARLKLAVKPRTADDATQSMVIAVTVDGIVDGDAILMPPGLVGMLVWSRLVAIAYDEKLSTLLRADIGFLSFRAYGRTIDDVPGIARDLSKDGNEVRTKADSIEQLQRLDGALTRMTLIVALVALLGGTAVLIASFYAAVERKKGELSLLRLLGFSRGDIFTMPILQSIMLAIAGFALALALFFAFAELINSQYANDLSVRGSICRLDPRHIGIFALATFLIAVASSLIAANRTLQIDPAEALRQE